jgi:hypothetical protein
VAKNRTPFYRVYVGDEMRLLKRLGTDAYGLYGILKNWVHDAEPYGHLVDAHGAPLSSDALVDMSGLKASAYRAAFQDLVAEKAVQPASLWLAEVLAKEYAGYIAIAQELCAGVRRFAVVNGSAAGAQAAAGEPQLLPALMDQQVRIIFGIQTGKLRKKRKSEREVDVRGDVTSPLTGDVRHFPTGDVRGDPYAQCHDNDTDTKEVDFGSQGSLPVLIPRPERERTSTTRAKEKLPMTWSAYRTHCMRVAAWEKRLTGEHPGGVSEERFDVLYEAEFHESWRAWQWIKHQMEASIPEPCRDDRHQFAEGSNFCVYCPHVRIEEP